MYNTKIFSSDTCNIHQSEETQEKAIASLTEKPENLHWCRDIDMYRLQSYKSEYLSTGSSICSQLFGDDFRINKADRQPPIIFISRKRLAK